MFRDTNIVRALDPAVLLRVGIGLTFLYAGAVALVDPATWISFVPAWFPIPPEIFITVYGACLTALAAVLIAGRWLPVASLLAVLHLAALLLGYGIDDATFQSFGLMFAALALLVLSLRAE